MRKELSFAIAVTIVIVGLGLSGCASAPEGVYVGLVSFAPTAADITGGAPIFLDATGKAELDKILDQQYKMSNQQGTSLYYADHLALSNMSKNTGRYPLDLISANIVTFTDGLDNNSTSLGLSVIEGKNFKGKPVEEYQQYIKGEIANRKIKGKPITAYSAGVKGSDVNDDAAFTASLKALASKEENAYTSISNYAELNERFKDIAKDLVNVNSDTTFKVVTPSYPVNTLVRITFDLPANITSSDRAARSRKYVQGRVDVSNGKYVLNEIEYSGVSSVSGKSIVGSMNGTNVNYEFRHFEGYNSNSDFISQWTVASGSNIWQINSEKIEGDDTKIDMQIKSSLIYLVLDSSTSLAPQDVIDIRNASKAFVQTLYDSVPQGNSRSVIKKGLPNWAWWVIGGVAVGVATGALIGGLSSLADTGDDYYY
jgi:hypothetical protein